MVFQDHRLFPNLTALENVAFGLRARGTPRGEARRQAPSWLERVGLPDLAGAPARAALRRPGPAGGPGPGPGHRAGRPAARRAAGRGRRRRPGPSSASVLRDELRRYPGARLIVTHDPIEAAALADRLVVLEDGRITQQGPLVDVTARPRSPWVATMVGLNLLHGIADGTTVALAGGALVATADRPRRAGVRRLPAQRGHPAPATAPRAAPATCGPARPASSTRPATGPGSGSTGRCRSSPKSPPPPSPQLHLADGGPVWAAVKATDIDVYPA